MEKRRPILGMLVFSFHSVGGSIIYDLLLCLGLGILALFLGTNAMIQTFVMLTAGSAPFIVLMKGEGTAGWEQYQLAMPIERKNLAGGLYLIVFIATLLMIPIIVIIWGLGLVFNIVTFYEIAQGLPGLSFVYGLVFWLTALVYPLACTKFGGKNESALMFTCLIAALAIVIGISTLGRVMGLTSGAISFLVIVISGTAFVVSLFITRGIYARMDF